MKRFLAGVLLASSLLAATPKKPKLILAVVIDQFRYDYLTRYRSEYHSGFDCLLMRGAVFTNARYQHFPTVTAVGHSTLLTGATPSFSGIVGNDWYDREAGRTVTSVGDSTTQLLGGDGAGSSPRRLLVDTVGDELKMAAEGKSRVMGISLKDRAAILPAGHMADAAYWFDSKSGNFASSTYYFADLPDWVKEFNRSRPADQYRGATWLDHTMTQDLSKLYSDVDASPFGNDLVERFVERALEAEQLGRHPAADLLAVSFSSNDFVGHGVGPDSPDVHEMCLRTDQVLGRLFAAVDRQVGLDNVLVVLTGDHGVAPKPEVNAARKMPGGRMPPGIVAKTVQAVLEKKFGAGTWVLGTAEQALYLNLDLIQSLKLDRAAVNRTAADAVAAIPHVFRVFTREQLMGGAAVDGPVGSVVRNGYYPPRGADLEVLLEPYWLFTQKGASHSTLFGYDTHVPVIFLGQGIRPGEYDNNIVVNDIAPTLATILRVETPSGSVGRVLTEMFAQ